MQINEEKSVFRYKILISYDGRNYSGFQKQVEHDTIQQRLETALSNVLKQEINIIASGRTDAGVSAIEQVCHFDIENELNEKRLVGHVNSLLPEDIRVLACNKTNEDFHARFNAKRKTYEYYFYVGNIIPVYDSFASNIGYNIDIERMKGACAYFLGEHDFSGFCASNTAVSDKVRTIYECAISEVSDNLYRLTITGNGFLYNMVRIIMGTLVYVGLGKIQIQQLGQIISSRDRSKTGKTMPSKGLCLKKVEY